MVRIAHRRELDSPRWPQELERVDGEREKEEERAIVVHEPVASREGYHRVVRKPRHQLLSVTTVLSKPGEPTPKLVLSLTPPHHLEPIVPLPGLHHHR